MSFIGSAILGGAIAAVTTGVVRSTKGVKSMLQANNSYKKINDRHNQNLEKFEHKNSITNNLMDRLGTYQLEILDNFDDFSNLIEQIQNKPSFEELDYANVQLPQYNLNELKNLSLGAKLLLSGLGSAATGTAGGFAAAGATKAAVMVLGTASTGTPIATLSGAALTNATLAAIGGGSLAAGGGGILLGTVLLNAATLGAGILIGGEIINFTSRKLSKETIDAFEQMMEAELKIVKSINFLERLNITTNIYLSTVQKAFTLYNETYNYAYYVIYNLEKTDWNEFSNEEKIAFHHLILLVGLLYKMCQVQILKQGTENYEINTINEKDIDAVLIDADSILDDIS